MKRRMLKHAASNPETLLVRNQAHMFAHWHTFLIYGSNTVYSMIPKNGCSTMRLSIAIANGAIHGPEELKWIHLNNRTFNPTLSELMRSDYSFVILRCPFARLASCFLDKIVGDTPDRALYLKALGDGTSVEAMSFRDFCASLAKPSMLGSNIHWAPQVRFLVFEEYDDYFCIEDFAKAIPVIEEKAGLGIVDARPLTRHGLDGFKLRAETETFADATVAELVALRKTGWSPHPRSLFDDAVRAAVAELYVNDIALFGRHFPGRGMFRD